VLKIAYPDWKKDTCAHILVWLQNQGWNTSTTRAMNEDQIWIFLNNNDQPGYKAWILGKDINITDEGSRRIWKCLQECKRITDKVNKTKENDLKDLELIPQVSASARIRW
jgi:hypothetical protein